MLPLMYEFLIYYLLHYLHFVEHKVCKLLDSYVPKRLLFLNDTEYPNDTGLRTIITYKQTEMNNAMIG